MARSTQTDNPQAVIYARASYKEKEDEAFSIPAQVRLFRDYADRKGF